MLPHMEGARYEHEECVIYVIRGSQQSRISLRMEKLTVGILSCGCDTCT